MKNNVLLTVEAELYLKVVINYNLTLHQYMYYKKG